MTSPCLPVEPTHAPFCAPPAALPGGQRRSPRWVRGAGFTLIELLIGLVIVAILASIALPSYRQHMLKSRRAEAQAFLMAVAARQTQFLIDTRGYSSSLVEIGVPTPSSVASAYTVALVATPGPPPRFSITATPTTEQQREACGTLSIDQNGSKTATRDGTPVAGCW